MFRRTILAEDVRDEGLRHQGLRKLICGILAGPPHHTKFKELVVSNKDIESDIMDQTKSRENESLKQEIRRLRQQMNEMHRAWAIGLPPPPFLAIDPKNTSSFPPKSQTHYPTVVDPPQHDSEFILSQKHHNTSTTFPLAPQYKPAIFTTPHIVSDLVAQSPTESSTLANRLTVVLSHTANRNNEMRQKLRDNFTPIGESYANLFQKLVQPVMITPLLGYTLDPHSRSFDPSVRYAYHSDV
ncbi:hypothetical protein P3S67_000553 [Capsicum chacoense]